MGCSASKPVAAASAARPSRRNSESFSSPSPSGSARSSPAAAVGRAFSLPTPLVHHPPVMKGDTHHLVSLTSTTYGSLLLIDRPSISHLPEIKPINFSDQISLSPDSVINTWELMDGLDSDSDQIPPEKSSIPANISPIPANPSSIPAKLSPIRSILNSIPAKPTSENGVESLVVKDPTRPISIPAKPTSETRPSFLLEKPSSNPAKPTSENGFEAFFTKDPTRLNSILAKPTLENGFDCLVANDPTRLGSVPAKIVEGISSIPPWSPKKPLWKHITEETLLAKLDPNVASTYNKALSFRQLSSDHPNNTHRSSSFSNHRLPPKNRAIVIYFTSLRGIRKTYEDCRFVRTVFRGFRVLVDERDISMDSLFKRELQGKLGGGASRLPQVFIGGKHVGGAEEIREMNESGELAGMLEDYPVGAEMRSVCGRCGDARFVPCPNCNGSRKLFGEDGGLMRCPKCNENGLIRCPFCCCF